MITRIRCPRLLFATLAAGFLALPVLPAAADIIRLEDPMAAASLHDGGVDMVVYYLEHEDHFEVVATYAAHHAPAAPARLRMGLVDGDRVSFGLPGLPGVTYTFARTGASIAVEATPADMASRVANAALAPSGADR
jgi:hypothetical protein